MFSSLKIFKQRWAQVILVLIVYFIFASSLPLKAHQGFYTISVFIKDLLIWIMPATVGLFIAHAIASFEKKAPLFILTLILFEAVSNLMSVWYAYGSAATTGSLLPTLSMSNTNFDFSPLYRIPFHKPSWWSADKGTIFGLLLGIFAWLSPNPSIKEAVQKGKRIAEWILTKIFARLIPFFVLGFVAQMYKTHLLQHVFVHYTALIVCLVVLLVIYISFLFLLGSGFSFATWTNNIKNILPAGGIAFTSGCSLSTMPWTIEGTSKNLKNKEFAKAVIPATTNIQQIGDCIANTFICCLIYKQFFGQLPDVMTWISFSTIFVLARFATAACLGGAIFVMLPIYEGYLSFNAEMIAIILAFNVILDPLITCTNVIANGALCRVYEKVWIYSQVLLDKFKSKQIPTRQ